MFGDSAACQKLRGSRYGMIAVSPHVNILPMDCTDVFSPSINLQNHKTITSHFTNFILRNILSFDFPLCQHNTQVDNGNL